MILQLLTLFGALGMFLYGMNLMSSGLQKAAGSGLRSLLSSITSNPFKQVMTGVGVTATIQSSSATTVMVVGFVNAGLLTLTQAVGVIMGANIGTTITAWIVSIFGFKADVSILAVPLMLVGFLLSLSKKGKRRDISEFIVGFSLLFLGLSFMKNSVPDLKSTPEVLEFVTRWSDLGFASTLIFIAVGTIMTLILQSSSATMALTLIMLSMGWIPFSAAASMVLGENIGTTITANIAASVGNVNARRAALTHTLFNIIGVIWAIALFKPFLSLVGSIIALLGLPNPAVDGFTVTAEQGGETAALYGISMLHTLFNCINTLLLVWFIPLIIKFVSTAIKDPKVTQAKEVKHLQYINAGMIDTPELAIEEAYKETIHFAKICRKELEYIKSAVESVNGSEFEVYREKLVKYENITDNIEFEVASFLNKLDRASLSESTMMRINALYRIVSELESIGDSGEAISRILSRKGDESKDKLSENSISIVRSFIGIIDRAFEAMINNIENRNQINSIENAIDAEICINRERNDIRSNITRNVSDGSTNYFESIMVLDIVQELERMGDYVINVSESIFESR